MRAIEQELCGWAEKVCPDSNRDWLIARYAGIRAGRYDDLTMLFSAAGRRTKQAMGELRSKLTGQPQLLASVQTDSWSPSDLLRVAGLVLADSHLPKGEPTSGAEDLFFRGSADEKRAVLLALPLLGEPEHHLELAVEACRTNTVPVFSAIACEGAYPFRYFNEQQFNQLVLKTIFLDLDARCIHGVRERMTPTLRRALDDFRAERTAAGRSVPASLSWLTNGTES